MNDVNIIGGKLCDHNGTRMASIGIKSGKITCICENAKELPKANKTINARNKLVVCSMTDTHTHIRGGGFSYREDFSSGTKAAVSGGVTTIIEMPGGKNPVVTPQAFNERFKEMQRDCICDFRMYAGLGYDNTELAPQLARCGATGFKTFMNPPLKDREKEFYGLCSPDEKALKKVMSAAKESGLTLTIHCEDFDTIKNDTQKIIESGGNTVSDYFKSHSEYSEIKAVKTALRCAKLTGCKINIAHVSTAQAAELCAKAKENGVDVKCETTAHYLFYDTNQMKDYGCFARMKPPFRQRETVDRLCCYANDGMLDYLGSDHAPFTLEEKCSDNSIWKAADGLSGIEMSMPLILELLYSGKITEKCFCDITSYNAAQRFGLKSKGLICEGYDADIAVIDMNANPRRILRNSLLTKAKHNGVIYEKTVLHTKIQYVISKGRVLMDNSQMTM